MDLTLTLGRWSLAAAPIALVLLLLVVFRWSGARAGAAGWAASLLIGALVFRGGPLLLATSQLEGLLLTLFVLYIIWMALLLYRVVERAGAIAVIGRGIVRLTGDRLLQLLILGWVFSAFLQGVAGFGVPIAVVAPLLIGLGFEPVIAVAAVAIGHSWSVTFGDIAASFNALIASSGLSGAVLAPWSALLLGVACLGCGLAVAHLLGRWSALARSVPAVLLVGGAMAGTQALLAMNGLWNLAGFVAGLVGLLAAALVTRLPLYRAKGATHPAGTPHPNGALHLQGATHLPLWLAVLPYLILIVLVSLAELWPPLHSLLNHVQITARLPEVSTGLGWLTPARAAKSTSLFGHGGALLAYSALLTLLIYRAAGLLRRSDLRPIVAGTVRGAIPSSLGIAWMVGMATIMERCGMTVTLARGLSSTVGRLFPVMSPFVGLLGAFMTGSNTNSNVLFAPLQKSTAELLGLLLTPILAAQTTGGALGSMIAPAKVIVGCCTAGLQGQEGRVLRRTLPYALLLAALAGLIAWAGTVSR